MDFSMFQKPFFSNGFFVESTRLLIFLFSIFLIYSKNRFWPEKIPEKRVLLYLEISFHSIIDVLVLCTWNFRKKTKYMYFVLDEKQGIAQRHVLCTWNENHGFARASVTYVFGCWIRPPLPLYNIEKDELST